MYLKIYGTDESPAPTCCFAFYSRYLVARLKSRSGTFFSQLKMLSAANFTSELSQLLPNFQALNEILERVDEDPNIPLDRVSLVLTMPEFLQRNKRDIMEDIVASYSTVFGSNSSPAGKKKKKKPVVFLPNSPQGKDCEPSNRMSSFGYLSFMLSLINAVVNAANNVNNNQNDNNNNNNNNNDNNNNVNVANSNLNQNNDNMVTAGRRRRILNKSDLDFQDILRAHAQRHARSKRSDLGQDMIHQSLIASAIFMDLWQNPDEVDLKIVLDSLEEVGPWARIMGEKLAMPF